MTPRVVKAYACNLCNTIHADRAEANWCCLCEGCAVKPNRRLLRRVRPRPQGDLHLCQLCDLKERQASAERLVKTHSAEIKKLGTKIRRLERQEKAQ